MSRFTIEAQPDTVRLSAERLAGLEAGIHQSAARLAALLAGVQGSWEGRAADAMEAEGAGLQRQLSAAAPHFVAASAAVRQFADALEDAQTVGGPRLNCRWQDATDDHAMEVRLWRTEDPTIGARGIEASNAALDDTRRALDAEFDQLMQDLHERGRRAGEQLAAATVVAIDTELARVYAGGGLDAFLLGLLGDPRAAYALQQDLPLTLLRQAFTAQLPKDSATLGRLLDTARAQGMPPLEYRKLLQAYWQAKAFERAGIDPDEWRPELGAAANRESILKGYEYYRTIFQGNPDMLWAGMANMVGPGFAAGFFDLSDTRALARALAELPGLPPDLERGLDGLANATDGQLEFYEMRFLTMQKNIFTDMAGMHEAYLAPGGMANIEEMLAANLIDARTRDAWLNIDEGSRTGNRALLAAGAEGLARREQFDIIGDDWDAMRAHPPFGDAMTYVTTVAGETSIPGTRAPGEVRPLVVTLTPDLPLPDSVNLPDLPDGWDLPDLPRIGGIDLPNLPDLPNGPNLSETPLPPDHASW